MAGVNIKLDAAYLEPDLTMEEVAGWQDDVQRMDEKVRNRTGAGSDFLGWVNPSDIAPEDLVARVEETAGKLREISDALVVIGIGGSYLGARAVIEALAGDDAPVYFAGNNISASYLTALLEKLKGKRVALNVISKSGTTTEPAIAFRILREWLSRNARAEDVSKLIVATTDASRGALLKLATDEGYERFVVPDDVGGRYSVLTPVGLLPIAYAGVDIRALVQGAKKSFEACQNADLRFNPAYSYAAARNCMYDKGYAVEMFAHFEPRLQYVAEWWKQLYGESEGKENKALFPASVNYTADLHSMGQYAQQGRRFLLETFVMVEGGEPGLKIPAESEDLDGLGYLEGREVSDVNFEAYRATALAHREGGLPNMTISIPRLDAENLGALLYFFEIACAVSGYLLRVNPFNQPGVEAYKKHMFALLGKPGFEEQTKELRSRIGQQGSQSVVSFG